MHLNDGTVNQGFFMSDGVHLNAAGSNKVVFKRLYMNLFVRLLCKLYKFLARRTDARLYSNACT